MGNSSKAVLFLIIVAAAVLTAACGGGEKKSDAGTADGGFDGGQKPSLFADGCPPAGKSLAKKITNPFLKMDGPDAIGTVGDYLLMNEKAAFIIQGTGHPVNTFYYYPGITVDAVAVDNCAQASRERFEELWIIMGKLNATDFPASVLRAFNGQTFEIANDGSDGNAAVVRVTGADDTMWFIETQLIGESMRKGKPKQKSGPFGIEIAVEYTLAPGSQVLQANVIYKNKSSTPFKFLSGGAAQFGDSTTVRYYANSVMTIGSWSIDQEVPWIASADNAGDGSWIFGMKKAMLGTMNIAGVMGLLDMNQIIKPLELAPAGSTGDTVKTTYFLAVGGKDSNSGTRNMLAVNPEPIPDAKYKLSPLAGKVIDAQTGEGMKGVLVELKSYNKSGSWMTMDSFYTDGSGRYSGEAPDFGSAQKYMLVATAEGRTPAATAEFSFPVPGDRDITMQAPGKLHTVIKDAVGTPLPAKVTLWQKNFLISRLYPVNGDDLMPVEPGDYEVSVTRGFEYNTYHGTASVKAGQVTELAVTLSRTVDTPGWLSYDGHAHAGPSPDNTISIKNRIASAAAEGLEVAVSTDHEYIGSWQSGVDELGLSDWIATVIGQEVTANLPEHTNIFPVVPDYDADVRGGYVKWFGLDLDQIYSAERVRGAGLVQLNHPRNSCNYMCLIDYNRLTGKPNLTDPTALGFDANQQLWSWNFDLLEFQNGPAPIFLDPLNPKATGMFDDWQSFINLGHRITAVGNSDAHDWDIIGTPRNYFASSTDDPKAMNEDEMVSALKEGRVVVSNGAFARVKIDGTAGIGDVIFDNDSTVDLYVRLDAPPEIDVSYFKVYVNCDQALSMATTAPNGVVKYEGTLKVPVARDANVVVMGFGKHDMPRGMAQYNPAGAPRVITNPIYVDVDGNGKFDPPGGKTCTYDLNAP